MGFIKRKENDETMKVLDFPQQNTNKPKSFLDIKEREENCCCDYLFWLMFDGNANKHIVENQFNYCPHCGGKLTKIKEKT